MGLASIFESFSIVCNCFLPPPVKAKKKNFIHKKVVDLGEKYNISTLPVLIGKDITDLYPITDQVHKWNIFIVGKNKNYILAQIYDLDIGIDADELLNKTSDGYLNDELNDFFNPAWDKTLEGNDLQFLMLWSGITYFVNTYFLSNGAREVIGAVMFVRSMDIMPTFSTSKTPKTPKKKFDFGN